MKPLSIKDFDIGFSDLNASVFDISLDAYGGQRFDRIGMFAHLSCQKLHNPMGH